MTGRPLATPLKPARAGRIGMVQVIACQLAAMAVASAFAASQPAAALVAAPLLLPVLARHRGRWWYEALMAWSAMRARQRAGDRAATHPDARGMTSSELARLCPLLVVQNVTAREAPVGIGADGSGWFAAIAMTATDGLGPAHGGLHIGSLIRQAGSLSTVQVVVRASRPAALADPRSPCAMSYLELCQSLAVPGHFDTWIAMRIELDDAADRDSDEKGVHHALCNAVLRISDVLTAEHLPHRVLDAAGLKQALADAYGPDSYDGGGRRVHRPGESWKRWQTAHATHICYGVTGWPARPSTDVLAYLADVPEAFSVSVALMAGTLQPPRREGGQIAARVVVRVVAAPGMVRHCQRHLRAGARRLGLRLTRLDGEQGPGVYATTPTAAAHGWDEVR